MSGLAQVQLFSSDRVCKPRVAQPLVIQEGFSGVPSGSGGYVGGREYSVDDDEDVDDDDDVYNDRNLLRRIGILRGWLTIYMCGFCNPSRILRLLLNNAANMRSFSLYPILQSLHANS